MAQVPFNKLNSSSLREAARKSIQEAREQESAKEEVVRVGRMTMVTHVRTGERGWICQELNYGFHYQVRWVGKRGQDAVTQERVEDIEFDKCSEYDHLPAVCPECRTF